MKSPPDENHSLGGWRPPPPSPPPIRIIPEPLLWRGVALGGLVAGVLALMVMILLKLMC